MEEPERERRGGRRGQWLLRRPPGRGCCEGREGRGGGRMVGAGPRGVLPEADRWARGMLPVLRMLWAWLGPSREKLTAEKLGQVAVSSDGKRKGDASKAPPPERHQRRKGLDRNSKALGRVGMSGQLGAFEQLEPLIRTSV